MKLTSFFMFLALFKVSATAYTQPVQLNISIEQKSFEKILREIKQKSDYKFLYQSDWFDQLPDMSIEVKDAKIETILDELIVPHGFAYTIKDKTIVFRKVPQKKLGQAELVNAQTTVKGTITDENGDGLPGASVVEKGTENGTVTDLDGNFTFAVSDADADIEISYIGFATQLIPVNGRSVINVAMKQDLEMLGEVVVVGYGTQKKSNITSAVSTVGDEVFENRPTANAFQSLQGTVPGLVISNSSSGGEPGAASNINVRGLITSQNGTAEDAEPLILVDGIRMDLNNINPADIESVSVLKDAASASIYGSQAAGGVVLITTKSGKSADGKIKVNYSNNFSFSRPTIWPKNASPIDFAYAVNDARINNNQSPYHDDDDLANILANMENPGSAPTIEANTAGTNWSYTAIGIDATGATDWEDIIFKDWATRSKHDLSLSGGTDAVNYYFSLGAYNEGGLLAVGDESFQRYNLDAKVSGKANEWLTLELYSKFRKSYSDFPTETNNTTVAGNKSRVFDLLSKLKPTLPQFDPIYGTELLQHSYYPFWEGQRVKTDNNQVVVAPKIVIEPIEGLAINAQFNYRRDNNLQEIIIQSSQVIRPEGLVDRITQENTSYTPTFYNSEYVSPNLYATYNKSIGNHNLEATVGYQTELFKSHQIAAYGQYLISDNFVSLSTAIDAENEVVSDDMLEWSNQATFGRFRYNFNEKYLFGLTVRQDGSSRFAPGERTAESLSFEVGYNIAREAFWPTEAISRFKLSASRGAMPNQNGPFFGYLNFINVESRTSFLFDGSQEFRAIIPGLSTQSLTWENVKTTNIGLDVAAFDDKLNLNYAWYRTDVEGFVAESLDLPAQLGTDAPLSNAGTSRVQGWEMEVLWRQRFGDFGYSVRGVLNDYKRSIVEYPNETNSLAQTYYVGQDLGEIRGLKWAGWFQTDDEYQTYDVDQSFVSGDFWAGDTKYADLNGDGVINNGDNTVEDSGDFSVIGNSTPRYQYSITLGMTYKNFDFNALFQGVAKRDVLLSNHQRFRGPAQGPFHINVWEEHLDYFRAEDTESPLGPNTDAYFPAPYTANPGNNNRNYRYAVDRYIQDGSYLRLKSLQIGYTIPKVLTERVKIDKLRVYATGENLFTITDLMFFDPEVVTSNVFGSAQSYPLSQILSFGVNVSF